MSDRRRPRHLCQREGWKCDGFGGLVGGTLFADPWAMTYHRCLYFLPLVAVLFVLIPSTGCGNAEEDALNAAQERWEEAQITDYTVRAGYFYFGRSAFRDPTDDALVTVRDGAVASAIGFDHDDQTHSVSLGSDDFRSWYTVEGMFRVIEDALKTADQVTVDYDPETGIPLDVEIDRHEEALDDELGYRLIDFQAQ